MTTYLEHFMAEGMVKGMEKGMEKGIGIGEARGMVLAFLRARFKNVSKDIEGAVRRMMDLTALESLAVHAETCQSLDEFAEALQ